LGDAAAVGDDEEEGDEGEEGAGGGGRCCDGRELMGPDVSLASLAALLW
jgi:hypothetical protein